MADDRRVARCSRVGAGVTELLRTRVFTPDVVSVAGPSYAEGRLFLRNIKEMVAVTLER